MSHSWTYFLSMFQVHCCELMVSTLFHSLLIWRPRVNKLFLFMACHSAAQRKSNRDGWSIQWFLKLLMGCGTYPVFSHFFFFFFFWPKWEANQVQSQQGCGCLMSPEKHCPSHGNKQGHVIFPTRLPCN